MNEFVVRYLNLSSSGNDFGDLILRIISNMVGFWDNYLGSFSKRIARNYIYDAVRYSVELVLLVFNKDENKILSEVNRKITKWENNRRANLNKEVCVE